MTPTRTPYETLLEEILTTGVSKPDRTGTGTLSLFGNQMRFDLTKGFPLVTTKKMFIKGVVEELLWFISGSTNEKDLSVRGVRWWEPWAEDDGELGPIYGQQLRYQSAFQSVKPKLFDPAPTDTPLPILQSQLSKGKPGVRNLNARTVDGVGYYGDYDRRHPQHEMLVKIWRDMIGRCYDQADKAFPGYGGAGVHVSERWQCYANFQQDFRSVTNWEQKLEYPREFSLDKDTLCASNRYDVSTCMWASQAVQNANKSNTRHFTSTDPGGNERIVTSIGSLAKDYGLNLSAVHRCLNGQLKTHHGWSNFQYIEAPEGMVTRYYEVDQLKALIASIKHDPHSRRHNIVLWSAASLPWMKLPPCHGNLMQFYVNDGKLSLVMHQRSGDMLLGVPVNIASYALLTHMVAAQTGLVAGSFIHTLGDAHLYKNHVEQATEQLSREPYPWPTLDLGPAASIFEYTADHIVINNYRHHPTIKGAVAV